MNERAAFDIDATATPARNYAARLAAVQALYLLDFDLHKPERVVVDFINRAMPVDSEMPVPEDFDPELFAAIVAAAVERKVDIDGILRSSLDEKWPLDRIERILRALLRAGAAELMKDRKVDTGIIINDYVNVAHSFFAGKEPGLANAVLDKIAKILRA